MIAAGNDDAPAVTGAPHEITEQDDGSTWYDELQSLLGGDDECPAAGQSETLVPVMGRFVRGWPESQEGKPADAIAYQTLGEALTRTHEDDAHFAAYSVPSVLRRLARSPFEALAPLGVKMVLFLLDVEPAGHAPVTPEWWVAEGGKLERLAADHPGAFTYRTRGGYRVVYELAEPMILRNATDAERWKATYSAWLAAVRDRYGIEADPTCKDWTRLYRLPRVVRDGVPQEPETTGDPHMVGVWSCPVEIGEIAEVPERSSEPPVFGAEPLELLERVRERLRAHGPAIQNDRGNEHTRTAWGIVSNDYALSPESARALILEWNATCRPPWDEDELFDGPARDDGQTWHSPPGAARVEWDRDAAMRAELGIEATPAIAAAETRPPEAYPNDVLELLGNVSAAHAATSETTVTAEPGSDLDLYQRALADVQAALDVPSATRDIRLLFVPAAKLIRQEHPDPPWLVPGLVKRGGVFGIVAPPKSIKTWTLQEIAFAVATGTNAFGKLPVGEPAAVAYFFAEDIARDVQSHLLAFAAGRDMEPEIAVRNLFVQPAGEHIDLMRIEHVARIIASCRAIERDHRVKLGLLVLEPLRDIHSGKENESDDMGPVMQRLKLLAALVDCTVGFAHHSKKPDGKDGGRAGNDVRGSGAIWGSLDALVSLRELVRASRGTRQTFTTTVKAEVKGARAADPFELELAIEDDARGTAVWAGWQVKGDAAPNAGGDAARDEGVTEVVNAIAMTLARKEPPPSSRRIRKMVGGGQKPVDGAIKTACERGLVTAFYKGRAHRGWVLTSSGDQMANPVD